MILWFEENMQLNTNSLDIRYRNALTNEKKQTVGAKADAVSFTGFNPAKLSEVTRDSLQSANAQFKTDLARAAAKKSGEGGSFLHKITSGVVKFIKKNFTEGETVTYGHREEVLESLRKNFGSSFDNCFEDISSYNNLFAAPSNNRVKNFFNNAFQTSRGKKDQFVVIRNDNDNLISFHKDPFFKNVCQGVKEFTVGTILDICISAREGFRNLNAKFGTSNVINSTNKRGQFFSTILDRRIAEKKARDSFYKVSGIFEQVTKGIESIPKKRITVNPQKTNDDIKAAIKTNIANLAQDSIGKASKKVGKYNTKTERAWNRLGTGFVSATFAATDFYNISMLQNNDPEKANASGRKRFMQDMRRQGLTAGITYVVLGALQKSVNNSVLYAALSLGGVTLISEILSRLMGGISLTPLSPEEAKEIAEKKENKKAKNKNKEPEEVKEEPKQIQAENKTNTQNPTASNNFEVFNVFTNKVNDYQQIKVPSFTANKNLSQTQNNQPQKEDGKKKSGLGAKIGKWLLGAVGLSLSIGYLRTKNVGKIDDIIKSMSAKYNQTIDKLTRRRLILPKDDVEGFLSHLQSNNFVEQAAELKNKLSFATKHGTLTGQAPAVRRYLPKKEINPNGYYYDFGWVESKGRKTALNILLYPFNTVNKLLQKGNNLVKMLFGIKPVQKEAQGISKDTAVAFIEKYATKYRDALNKNDMHPFTTELEDAFTRHFSEANSQNKNTSVAMISRFLITIISGYFFVNDYRNEVLIESKGKDVERANATMKERVGHKLANFFLNSMFMDIFNTTFENIYLGSVVGATGVAMATEFTNETAVRASICTPTSKMTREELIEYENERLNDEGLKGNYFRTFMKLTGKKPLSEKAKPKDKK